MHVLLVCSGNTCRSPLAEALLRRMLDEAGRGDIAVSSAGTGAYDGAPASEGAYLVGLERGLDLSGHRARLLDPDLLRSADLVLAMSGGHLARVARLGGAAGPAVLLGEYAGAGPVEIRDPFGGEVEGYRRTLDQLEELMRMVRDRLIAEAPP